MLKFFKEVLNQKPKLDEGDTLGGETKWSMNQTHDYPKFSEWAIIYIPSRKSNLILWLRTDLLSSFFSSQLNVKPVYKRVWLKRQWFRTWLDFSDCLSKAKTATDLFLTHFWTHFNHMYAFDLLDQTEVRKIDVCRLNFNCCFCLSNQTIDFRKFKIAKSFLSTGFSNAFFWVTTVMFLPWRPELKNQLAYERFTRNIFLVLDLASKCW